MLVKLGDAFTIGSGGTPSKQHPEYYGGSIPWVKTGDLGEQYIYSVDECITEEGLKNSSARLYAPDTVLVAMYGATIGATSILKTTACTNQACAAFIPNKEVIPEYLYYFLLSKKQRFVQDGVGGAQPNISATYLKGVLFPLRTYEEQSAIVDKLSRVTEVIKQRKQQLHVLDQLIKARFVEMFGEETEHGVPLKECCIDVRGGGTPSMQHPEYYGGNVPFIKSGDVRGDMVSSGALWLTEKALEETIAKYVPQGSVLVVNRSAALLREFRAAIAARPVVINQDIKAFIPKHDYTSEYLLWAIKIQTQLLLTKVTTVLTSHIDLKELLELRIANVSIERQKEFSAFISQVDKSKVVDLSVFTNRAKSYII